MRYLVVLLFLLAGCETFGWPEKSATQNKYIPCNVPQRLMALNTTPEFCRILGGHRVDENEMDELEAYYQSLTSS